MIHAETGAATLVMSAKPAWATGLKSLVALTITGNVSNFRNWLTTPGFPALTQLSLNLLPGEPACIIALISTLNHD